MSRPDSLLSLPQELLLALPAHLHDIEDFKNLSSTCRTLHSCLASISPRIMFRLAASASIIFFRPSPHFLVAAVARQIGVWASRSEENALKLRASFRGGMQGLMELCLEHAEGLTMDRIRELHAFRFSTINPVTDLIDKCIGQQWYATPDFWNGGVDDAYTIDADPPENFFHLAIYGGLFGHAFDALLNRRTSSIGAATLLATNVDIRLEFVKYCIPDSICYLGARDMRLADGTKDPRRTCEAIGPYLPYAEASIREAKNIDNVFREHGNQLAIEHLLFSSRWNPSWDAVREKVGGDFDVEWKQDLWKMVVWCQGLEGMEMIRPQGVEGWVERLYDWRKGIERMEKEPVTVDVGWQGTYEYPDLIGDLWICIRGYAAGS